MSKSNYLFLILLFSALLSPAAGTVSKTTTVLQKTAASADSTQVAAPVSAALVEKVFRETRFSYFIFDMIKKELQQQKKSDARMTEESSKIYWEIMNEYADAFRSAGLTAAHLNCQLEAYAMPEAAPFKSVRSIQNYTATFKDIVLTNKKWNVDPKGPTKEQVLALMHITNYEQHILANLTGIFVANRLEPAHDKVEAAYYGTISFYQYLLTREGSKKESFQKFLSKLNRPECQKFLKIQTDHTVKRGLKLITDRISK